MLTVEQIEQASKYVSKKAFGVSTKYSNGIEIVARNDVGANGNVWGLENDGRTTGSTYIYHHFLQRVIEGINVKGEWWIDQYAFSITAMRQIEFPNKKDFIEANIGGRDTKLSPDQAKEKVIKHILAYEEEIKC